MSNEEQLTILKQGVKSWNKWRRENPNVKIDLSGFVSNEVNLRGINLNGADLSDTGFAKTDLREAIFNGACLENTGFGYSDLSGVDFKGAILSSLVSTGSKFIGADFSGTNLFGRFFMSDLRSANLRKINSKGLYLVESDLSGADLSEAILVGAQAWYANFSGANLSGATLVEANLNGANLSGAKLINTNLSRAQLVGATVENAIVIGGNVHGINVWDLKGRFKEQKDINVGGITIDNIKVAQFISMILNNEEIRDVINTLTSKTVLILGRFSIPERKEILDALRNKLREYDLLPIVFDFDRPTNRDFTETIKTLAGISYFVIADITNPKSSPLELQATVPDFQVPFVPIIQEGEQPFAMMGNLQTKYSWVLDTISYDSIDTLIKVLKPGIIDPALDKHNELKKIKASIPTIRSAKDLLEQ